MWREGRREGGKEGEGEAGLPEEGVVIGLAAEAAGVRLGKQLKDKVHPTEGGREGGREGRKECKGTSFGR